MRAFSERSLTMTTNERPDPRDELTVEQAWEVAIENEVFGVELSAAMAALARVKDAVDAGETVGAWGCESEAAVWARNAALEALDRGIKAIEAIEAAARRRRSHDARG
jgi:hypothetical protein